MTSSHERISIVYYVIGIGTFIAAAIWAVLTFYVQEQNNLTYSYGAPEIHINMEQIKLPHNNDLDKSDKHLYIQTTVTVNNKGDKAVNLNFACPSRTVLSSSSGGMLLRNLEQMIKIIESVKQSCPDLSLSLKLNQFYI